MEVTLNEAQGGGTLALTREQVMIVVNNLPEDHREAAKEIVRQFTKLTNDMRGRRRGRRCTLEPLRSVVEAAADKAGRCEIVERFDGLRETVVTVNFGFRSHVVHFVMSSGRVYMYSDDGRRRFRCRHGEVADVVEEAMENIIHSRAEMYGELLDSSSDSSSSDDSREG